MPQLQQHDSVYVLRFAEVSDPAESPDNVFSPGFLDNVEQALDTLEAVEGPAALVTTGAGKFYSNGLDVEYAFSANTDLDAYIGRVHAMYARLIRLPMATVAAVNGHAFGAGAMLVLCHDHRLMRDDRGYWCLPEAARAMPFPAGMNALVSRTVPVQTARTAMLTSHRYGAAEACAAGIVDAAVSEAALLDEAIARAQALTNLDGKNLQGIRTGLYADALHALENSMP